MKHFSPFSIFIEILCFVDHASLYNLVNKANLVHNLFLVYLFVVYLSISTCYGQICAHHQEKQLCFCNTWYLLSCLVPDSHSHRITSTKCCKNTVVSPVDGNIVALNMYRLTNILRINCAPSCLYLQDLLQYPKKTYSQLTKAYSPHYPLLCLVFIYSTTV